MAIRFRTTCLFIAIICTTSCDVFYYTLPFPEFGEYFAEEVTYYREIEETFSNFEFAIARQQSTHIDETYNIKFMNEYDHQTYFAKLSFDVNGIKTEVDATYMGKYEREPGNIYKFSLSFIVGDKQITEYSILLSAMYLGDASTTANTKFIHFAVSSSDWTTGHMDIITIAEEEFGILL